MTSRRQSIDKCDEDGPMVFDRASCLDGKGCTVEGGGKQRGQCIHG